jgi:hypothetical protein
MNRGRRWDLHEAVEESGLPHNTRHILQTLLLRADTQTVIIPPERMPTVAQLAHKTGLRRQDVGEALKYAVMKGWLRRERGGGKGNPTSYTVLMPSECVPAGGTQ